MMNKHISSKKILTVTACLFLFSILMTILSLPAKKSAEKARLRKYEIAKILQFENESPKNVDKLIFREDISSYKRSINISSNKEVENGDFIFEDENEKLHIKWHCIDKGIIIIDE